MSNRSSARAQSSASARGASASGQALETPTTDRQVIKFTPPTRQRKVTAIADKHGSRKRRAGAVSLFDHSTAKKQKPAAVGSPGSSVDDAILIIADDEHGAVTHGHIDHVPREILYEIFRHVKRVNVLIGLRRTCKRWNAVLRDPRLLEARKNYPLKLRELAVWPVLKPDMNLPLVAGSRLTEKMFGILTGWMLEVVTDFKMSLRTFGLAVTHLVRFMNARQVRRSNFQCLGQVCLWIASKCEDVYEIPELPELVAISDYTYTAAELCAMERSVLQELAFSLQYPTGVDFLELLLWAHDADKRVHVERVSGQTFERTEHDAPVDTSTMVELSLQLHTGAQSIPDSLLRQLAHFLLQLGLHSYMFAVARPSMQAAAAMVAALAISKEHVSVRDNDKTLVWSARLADASQIVDITALLPLIAAIMEKYTKAVGEQPGELAPTVQRFKDCSYIGSVGVSMEQIALLVNGQCVEGGGWTNLTLQSMCDGLCPSTPPPRSSSEQPLEPPLLSAASGVAGTSSSSRRGTKRRRSPFVV